MAIDASLLPGPLRLEPLTEHLYGAPFERPDAVRRDVVFGGQILAQMIIASALAGGDDKEVKSIHAVFGHTADFSRIM
jgi:acyl-CoA thioesterase